MEIGAAPSWPAILAMGYGRGSTADLRIVGSRASHSVLERDRLQCAPGTGLSACPVASTSTPTGWMPIVLWSKKEFIRLPGPESANTCTLRIGLLQAPPRGEIVLFRAARPCLGTFTGLPEGAGFRAEHAGSATSGR